MSSKLTRGARRFGQRCRAWLVSCAVLSCLTALARAAGAAEPPSAPPETVRLTNGSVLVGRILSKSEGKIRILVEGVGEVVVDSMSVAPSAPSHTMSGSASRWSGNLSVGVLYVSAIAPGTVGTNLGVELTSHVAREFRLGRVTLDGTLGYSRVEPVAATIDEWGVMLGSRHPLHHGFMVLATTQYEVNRVQYLQYRSITLAGIGYSIWNHPKASLIVAPGMGYSKSEQTPYGRILSFGNRQPPNVEGWAWGAHDMTMLHLSPTVMLQQQLLWLFSVEHEKFHQLQLDVRLTGAVTDHLKMLIVYAVQYDSSMPAPVQRAVQSLNSGIQVAF